MMEMKRLLFLFFLLTPKVHASVIDYSPPQDVLGHWEFDLYDATGAQRGTTSNPLYFLSNQLPTSLGGKTLANSTSFGLATDQFSLLSTAALQATANASLASIDAGTPAALGQTTMANSQPVTLASDQSPLVAGAVYNTTMSTVAAGTISALQANRFGELVTIGRNKSTALQNNATTVIKSSAGRLHGVVIAANTTGGTLYLYDNATAASGTIVSAFQAATPTGGLLSTTGNPSSIFVGPLDIEFTNGLTAITAGSTSNFFVVVWY